MRRFISVCKLGVALLLFLPFASAAQEGADWWRTFDDSLLDSLIQVGREKNYNLAAAAKRIESARSSLRRARGGYSPVIGLNAGMSRSRTSGRVGAEPAATVQYFSAGASMSWEVDVFGKVAAQVKEAGAELRLTAAEYDAVMLSLEAEIADTYISLLVDRLQLEVANTHAASQKHIVDITEVRYKTGLASKLDVAQAYTLYYSTTALIPKLEASVEAGYNALSTLLATGREDLPQSLYAARQLPLHVGLAPDDAPLEAIRRRPDVVQSERSVDVAAAALGIERKQYLPSLSVQAAVGTEAHRFGDLFGSGSLYYSVAPTLSWTLFDGLQRRNATAAARHNMEVQADLYNATVVSALEEARDAIVDYKADLKYIAAIENVVEASAEAVDKSLDLYKQGLSIFSDVVDAQLNYLTYQNTLVQAKGDAIMALVDIYKALGGSW